MRVTLKLLSCVVVSVSVVAPVQATGVPSPANSTVPACIQLVGHTGGVAAPLGEFVVIVRDLAGNVIADEAVTVDLSLATELHIAAEQFDPDLTVDCVGKRVMKRTDVDGRAVFRIIGASNGGPAVSPPLAGRISAEHFGVLGSPSVSAYDLDGMSGVGANDLSLWLMDFGGSTPCVRSDHDCSGSQGANDLSVWLSAFGSGTMAQSAACP